MQKINDYLKKYIDEHATITECNQEELQGFSLILLSSFDYFNACVLGENILFVRPKEKMTVTRLQGWMKQIEEKKKINTAAILENPSSYEIKKMLMERTAFIVPGKQLNLPFLVLQIRTEKTNRRKDIIKFSPATQMVFLYILYSEEEQFLIENISEKLGISVMSVVRGLNDLVELGILSFDVEGQTKRKKIFCRGSKDDYFLIGKRYLTNPVREIVYVRKLPKDYPLIKSNLTALSEQTMLGESEQKFYAMQSKDRSCLEGLYVTKEQALAEKLPAIQLMKYNVAKLGTNGYIDPISLIWSLTKENERIMISIDELMRNYPWYSSENDEDCY